MPMQTDLSPEQLQHVLSQVDQPEGQRVARNAAASTVQAMALAGQKKNFGLGFALTFFFGPLGLLYASPVGAVVMFCGGAVVGFMTFGIGLFFAWLGSMIWSCIAIGAHNDRIDAALRAAQ